MTTRFAIALGLIGATTVQANNVSLHGQGYIYLENVTPSPPAPIPDNTGGLPLLNTKRFYWEPTRASLRIGETTFGSGGYSWAYWVLGNYSFAMGKNNYAGGDHSFVFGDNAATYKTHGVAIGASAFVDGSHSFALGYDSWVGPELSGSFAIGSGAYVDQGASNSYAIGAGAYVDGESGSYAIGQNAEALGSYSTAIGDSSYATGERSVALYGNAHGFHTTAIGGGQTDGAHTTAIGYFAYATGEYSTALGSAVTAQSPFSLSVGRYNLNKQKDGVSAPSTLAGNASSNDPVFEIGVGTSSTSRANALTVYRDSTSRFHGPLQIKAGTGYLTLQPGGSTSRTLTLPDMDGTMLTNNSALDPARLGGGTVAENVLPASVTKLGASIELDSTETTGALPWTRVSNKPTTLSGYGITDALAVARNAEGRITTPIRIEPQGDIPMFGATP